MTDIGLEANLYFSSFGDGSITELATKSGILNYELNTNTPSNGVSIFEADLNQSEETDFVNVHLKGGSGNADLVDLGSILTGIYYDMPTSPDLDLSMEIEFDGVNNIKTLNGSTITQANYQGSPWWYDKDGNKVEPWSVGESTGTSKRNGRRVWKLKFSYMSDKDLFASNYGSNTYMENHVGYELDDVDEMNWGQNLVTNPTINSNITGWQEYPVGSDNVAHNTDTDFTRTGAGSLKCTYTGSSHWAGKTHLDYQMKIPHGAHVKMSAYVYVPDGFGAMNNIFITHGSTVNFVSGSQNIVYADPSLYDTWQYVEMTFQMESSGDDTLQFYVYGNGSYASAGKYIFLDDVEVVFSNPSDFYYTIDTDDSFSAQVLNKISHGEKFIFQPDNTSNNPSDFAICVLDGDSFEMKRTAPNVYDIEMTIREVW